MGALIYAEASVAQEPLRVSRGDCRRLAKNDAEQAQRVEAVLQAAKSPRPTLSATELSEQKRV